MRFPAQLISSAVLSNQGRHFFLLKRLPEDDLELLTLLIVDGYRQADVARLWNCSRSAITQRINKIKIFLKKA